MSLLLMLRSDAATSVAHRTVVVNAGSVLRPVNTPPALYDRTLVATDTCLVRKNQTTVSSLSGSMPVETSTHGKYRLVE